MDEGKISQRNLPRTFEFEGCRRSTAVCYSHTSWLRIPSWIKTRAKGTLLAPIRNETRSHVRAAKYSTYFSVYTHRSNDCKTHNVFNKLRLGFPIQTDVNYSIGEKSLMSSCLSKLTFLFSFLTERSFRCKQRWKQGMKELKRKP